MKRYALLHLPYSGSLEHHFPTFPVCRHMTDHRYYDPLRLPNVNLRFVRYSLSAPDTFFAVTSAYKETSGSPHFPSYPYEHMLWSQTPVVSCTLAMSHTGLLPSAASIASAFSCYAGLYKTTTIHFSGLYTEPASLIPSGFGLPLPGLPSDFTADLPAKP